MTNAENVFKSRYMLLASDDKLRVQILAEALRAREARVGDLRLPLRDKRNLSGADLLFVDAHSSPAMQAAVKELQADVRTRWAAVFTLDFRTLVGENGAANLSVLEELVAPLTAADRALTEQAQQGTAFVTALSPLGPTRTLRALVVPGATLEAQIAVPETPEVKASVTLSNELVICAFLERDGERQEGWKALASILELSTGEVRVAHVTHPATMNIMEPLDLALRNAELLLEQPNSERLRDAPPARTPMRSSPPAQRRSSIPPLPPEALSPFGRTMLGIGPSARPPVMPDGAALPSARELSRSSPKLDTTMVGLSPDLPPPSDQSVSMRHPAAEPISTTEASSLLRNFLPPEGAPPAIDTSAPVDDLFGEQPTKAAAYNLTAEAAEEQGPAVPAEPLFLSPEPMAEPSPEEPSDSAAHEAPADPPTPEADEVSGLLMEPSGMTAIDVPEPPAAASVPPPPPPAPTHASRDEQPEGQSFVEPVSPTEVHAIDRRKRRHVGRIVGLSAAFAAAAALGIGYLRQAPPSSSTDTHAATGAAHTGAAPASAPAAFPEQAEVAQQPTASAPHDDGAALQANEAAPQANEVAPHEAAPQANEAAPQANEAAKAAGEPSPAPTDGTPAPTAAPARESAQPERTAAAAEETDEPSGNVAATDDPDALISEAKTLLGRKSDEARRLFESAVALAPKNPHAHAGLGQALLLLNQPAEAQKSLDTAIRLRPKRALYRVLLGDALDKEGKREEARAAWEKALELDPSDRDAQKRLGK